MKKTEKWLCLALLMGMMMTSAGCSALPQSGSSTENSMVAELPGDSAAYSKNQNGLYTGSQFFFAIPQGWIADPAGCTQTKARILQASSLQAYDPSQDPSFEIEVEDYHSPQEGDSLETLLRIKKGSYLEASPQEDKVQAGVFSGSRLIGESTARQNSTCEYYVLEHWKADQSSRARVTLQMIYYNEAQKQDLNPLLSTLDISTADEVDPSALVEKEEPEYLAEPEEVCLFTSGFSFRAPYPWVATSRSDATLVVSHPNLDGSSVSLKQRQGPTDARTWADLYRQNYGSTLEVREETYQDIPYFQLETPQGLSILTADCPDGTTLHIKLRLCTINEIQDLLREISMDFPEENPEEETPEV